MMGLRSGAIPIWWNSIEGWRLKVTKSNFQSQPLNKKILKICKKLKLKIKNVKKFVEEMM